MSFVHRICVLICLAGSPDELNLHRICVLISLAGSPDELNHNLSLRVWDKYCFEFGRFTSFVMERV